MRAAMPGFIGRKLCPELIIVPTNFEKYTSVSRIVKSVIADYDPNFCPMSLDEAYLDITEHLQKRGLTLPEERTFLCRDSSYADSRAHCQCDLNDIVRNYGIEGISLVNINSSNLNFYLIKRKTDSEHDKNEETVVDTDKNLMTCEKDGKSETTCPECKREFPPFDVKTFALSDEDAVRELRTRIEQKTRLTASAGE